MSYASDALIDALKRENNQLQAENARLKQELEAVGTAAYLYGRNDLADENAKLRELVRDIYVDMWHCGEWLEPYEQRMQELGVEVSDA